MLREVGSEGHSRKAESAVINPFLKAKGKYLVIERNNEKYYVAAVPGLPGCHTQAKNLDSVMKRAREVIECLKANEQ